jgi:hypothetical protein
MKKLQSSYSSLKTELAITPKQSGFRHCEEWNSPENKTHIRIASGCALIMTLFVTPRSRHVVMTTGWSEKVATGHEKVLDCFVAALLAMTTGWSKKVATGHEKVAAGHEKVAAGHEKMAAGHEKVAAGYEKTTEEHKKIIYLFINIT